MNLQNQSHDDDEKPLLNRDPFELMCVHPLDDSCQFQTEREILSESGDSESVGGISLPDVKLNLVVACRETSFKLRHD